MTKVNPSTVKLNSKGQVTLPWQLRQQLGLRSGDELRIYMEGTQVIMLPNSSHPIEAVFGILKAKVSVSLEEMETAIRQRAAHRDRN